MASDSETDESGDGEEETETEELDVRCSTSSLRASMSDDSLLLYYPDPIVTYSGSSVSSCQRFNVHDGGTVISVDWFGDRRTLGEERWDFDLMEIQTKICVVRRGIRGDDGDDVTILVDTVSMDRP